MFFHFSPQRHRCLYSPLCIYNIYQAAILISAASCFCFCSCFCRIGFVFVVNPRDDIDGFSDAGVGFYRLLNYIADEYDVPQAVMSMISVCTPHINHILDKRFSSPLESLCAWRDYCFIWPGYILQLDTSFLIRWQNRILPLLLAFKK